MDKIKDIWNFLGIVDDLVNLGEQIERGTEARKKKKTLRALLTSGDLSETSMLC